MKKIILIPLATLLFFIPPVSKAQSTTLVNPILKGFYPDPSIVKVDTDYYLINSTFSYFPGIPVMHSKDLKNWKQIGNVIHRPSQMDFMGERMTRGLFAPAISYHKGVFYMSCTDIDNMGNFVVTATDPAGPWSDPVRLPEIRGIDPSIFFDKDTDKAYILYNSDAPDSKPLYSGHRTIRMYEFDYENLKVVGKETQLVNGGVDITEKPVWIEGPHIWKRNGWYYLYAAEGGTSVNHSEVVFRSKSPKGPYVAYENNPILTQRHLPKDRDNPITSTGHAQFVEGPDGKTYSIFLAVRPYEGDYYNTGRETFIAPIEWKNDWPHFDLGGEEVKYAYEVGYKEKPQKGALPQSGNFAYTLDLKKGLDPSLLFMRTVDSSSFSISKNQGLVLKLKPETIASYGNPSFVGKRQQHLNSRVETEMQFSAASDYEKSGLVAFQNEKHFYFLAVTQKGGQQVIKLYKSNPDGGDMEELTDLPLEEASKGIKLAIESKGDTYSFHYSVNGKDWQLVKDNVDAKFLSTKEAGGFIGCLYGMYATSSGEKVENTASFEYLKYDGNDPVFRD